MVVSILDGIYDGKVFFFEKVTFENCPKYRELANKIDDIEIEFLHKLSKEDKDTYVDLLRMRSDLFDIENRKIFKAAFAMGVQFMDEICNSDLFNFRD